MGGSGRWLEIRGEGDAEALHEAVTHHIVEHLRRYTDHAIYEGLRQYLGEARYSDSWGGCDTLLEWTFPDGGGNCTRSMWLWMHWLPIAISVEWDAIAAIARDHGFELAQERWGLYVKNDAGFVELRGDVWLVSDDALMGDARHISFEELTADERAIVEAARAVCACGPCRQLTPKPKPHIERTAEEEAARQAHAEQKLVEGMMAAHARRAKREARWAEQEREAERERAERAAEENEPPAEAGPGAEHDKQAERRQIDEEDEAAARMAAAQREAASAAARVAAAEYGELEELARASSDELVRLLAAPERSMKAARQIARGAVISSELLLAMIRANAWSELHPVIEQYARRVGSGWDEIIAALPTLDERARTHAMFALASLVTTPEQTQWFHSRIRAALENEDDDAACALAILAGRLRPVQADTPMLLAHVLDRSFIREKMRASAVEGLEQLHEAVTPIPPEIRERLVRESERGGEGASLADGLLRRWS